MRAADGRFPIAPHKQVINGQNEPFLEICTKARSRRFDAGVGPVGLPEKTFWATAEASATASEERVARARPLGFPKQFSGRQPKLPRQPWQTRAVARARSVIFAGWPVGLPETIVRATKAAATASLALASVVLALGSGRTGFLETSFRAMQSGGSWTPPQYLWFQVYVATWAARATAKASATASLALASVVLALGGGWTGFPKQVSERCKAGGSWTPPQHMRPKAYVATRAAQPSGPSATEPGLY